MNVTETLSSLSPSPSSALPAADELMRAPPAQKERAAEKEGSSPRDNFQH